MRSPSFPQYPLESLRPLLIELFEEYGQTTFTTGEIYDAWGISAKSSGARSRMAALRSYELLKLVEQNDDVDYWEISRRGLYCKDYDRVCKSENHVRAVQRAALSPRVFKVLSHQYGGRARMCVSARNFQELGNEIVGHLIGEARPRFSRVGAGRVVAAWLKNLAYTGLLGRVQTLPYAGPFEYSCEQPEPLLRVYSDANSLMHFEVQIKERVTGRNIDDIMELHHSVSRFLERRRQREEEKE